MRGVTLSQHGLLMGGCTVHTQQCGRGSCLFLLVGQGSVLLLHNESGAMLPAPYVDEHGETNQNLKRSVRTQLDPERLRQLEEMWFSHQLDAEIGRFAERRSFFAEVADWSSQ
jgi:hypothetical protein